jgi:hypothetical protein
MSKSNPKSPGGARKKRETEPAAGPTDPRPAAAVRQRPKQRQPATEPEPADPQTNLSQTEMEVHHHPQLEHKPKSWKEYLLEGFMIFIAVMMGFIAENIREDITNSEHARRLTSQLVHDLKADTVQLNEIFRAEIQIVNNNDSLFSLLRQPFEKADNKRIQKLVADSHSLWPFHPSAGAIAAIKNELHLKQLSNSDIIGYISTYEKHTELLRTVQDIALQYQRSFLDPFLRLHLTPDNLDAAFNHTATISGQMRNLTPEDLTQLRADMVLVRINSRELVTNNRKLMHDAESLLVYVKKQYHPIDE